MGERVAELEARFSEFSGMHALMVANGSVANQLVFELWKVKHPDEPLPLVIVPAVTWVSSISPILMAGFPVQFCDVNLIDFSFDYGALERQMESATARGQRVIIWPTALIGFSPDMARLRRLAAKHGADLYLDSCENTFSRLPTEEGYVWADAMGGDPLTGSILASADITTTSGYVSHHWSTVEGGLVFFRYQDDYDLGRLFRNHGLTRSLPADHPLRQQIQRDNPTVDPQFLFALAGTNMRPTDVHAMFGLRDFERIPQSREHRNRIYRLFHDLLDHDAYYLPPLSETHVGFCLPIFVRREGALPEVKAALAGAGIESRPIIGANLLRQPPFKAYGRPEDFPNAEWIHWHGTYCGLHSGVTEQMVRDLTDLLNGLALKAAA